MRITHSLTCNALGSPQADCPGIDSAWDFPALEARAADEAEATRLAQEDARLAQQEAPAQEPGAELERAAAPPGAAA